MNKNSLKSFARAARRKLLNQVKSKFEYLLTTDSAEIRQKNQQINRLKEEIEKTSKDVLIEKVAYTWFNRFIALRFMDANGYTPMRVITPQPGFTVPQILADAKRGHYNEEFKVEIERNITKINQILDGQIHSRDPQNEVYQLLLVAICNYYYKYMPFMFEPINDYTELLIPDDLLSANSIIADIQKSISDEHCKDVEIIGWLYQFYISEKKDEVFDGLKKNKKITPENIPAATQLFTPHWIVRYLVENSLGRLWLLNRPGSKLIEKMDYYIKPEQDETDFQRIAKPEEIKICDPACGSGHMLTYAFDLLYAIYEEEGYEPAEIPEKILTNNLYGIEIDERAGELAAFALTMKARAKQRRFFNKGVKPNICVLENVHFDEGELKSYMDFVGRDLFTAPLQTTLRQFEEADNFGSLIRPDVTDVDGMLRILESKNVSGQLFISMTHQKVLQALRQADYLSPKYHVVIANPPYMGSKGMNPQLADWAKMQFPICWDRGNSDLFALFMERNFGLSQKKGLVAMITMQSWMFLSTYERFRDSLIENRALLSMAHLGPRAFDSIGGEVVSTTAFVFTNTSKKCAGVYRRLVSGRSEFEKDSLFKEIQRGQRPDLNFYTWSTDFEKIPGSPFAYWLTQNAFNAFAKFGLFEKAATACQGLATTDNNRFVRIWPEVSISSVGFGFQSPNDAAKSGLTWFPLDKGGPFRKWFGNNDFLVNWKNDGQEIRNSIINKYPYLKGNPDFVAKNPSKYFLPGITWGKVTMGSFSARYSPAGAIFSDAGMKAFQESEQALLSIAGLFNSKITPFFLGALSETINYEQGNIARLPYRQVTSNPVERLISLTKTDWDSFETSWDFTSLPLLNPDYHQPTLKATYQKLRAHWREMTLEMQRLEQENNRIFIEAYGLNDELDETVDLSEITLTCNPHYRYGNDKSEDELEALLLADTMRELVSYAVGCMFGRYSLDKPGLILANQGETLEDYLNLVPEPKFIPDEDNIIPVLEDTYFTDDIVGRFKTFLKISFGEKHYEENLRFVEEALEMDIRKYFVREFYKDHIKRYKKRPIYWMFSSAERGFNALIYMHRYRPDTVSRLLNEYLREYITKLEARMHNLKDISLGEDASAREKKEADKEIFHIEKLIKELRDYERNILYPLATQRVEIDLDDGVKVNYCKFGEALFPVPGLCK